VLITGAVVAEAKLVLAAALASVAHTVKFAALAVTKPSVVMAPIELFVEVPTGPSTISRARLSATHTPVVAALVNIVAVTTAAEQPEEERQPPELGSPIAGLDTARPIGPGSEQQLAKALSINN